MSRVFNVLQSLFRCVAASNQRVALAFSDFTGHTFDVLRHTFVFRSVTQKVIPTQWDAALRNSATLLLLKYFISVHMHVCACAYRVRLDRRLKCCAPRLSVSA